MKPVIATRFSERALMESGICERVFQDASSGSSFESATSSVTMNGNADSCAKETGQYFSLPVTRVEVAAAEIRFVARFNPELLEGVGATGRIFSPCATCASTICRGEPSGTVKNATQHNAAAATMAATTCPRALRFSRASASFSRLFFSPFIAAFRKVERNVGERFAVNGDFREHRFKSRLALEPVGLRLEKGSVADFLAGGGVGNGLEN